MHPCGWENHKPTSMKKQRCGRNSSTNHPHGYIFMHPCGWETHKRTWMKKYCIGGKNRWIIHVNQTFVCIYVDERIRNAHGLKKQRVDEIVRQIIEMDFTFVYIPVDGDSGSRSRMTWSPGWHKKSFLANEKRNESSVNISSMWACSPLYKGRPSFCLQVIAFPLLALPTKARLLCLDSL